MTVTTKNFVYSDDSIANVAETGGSIKIRPPASVIDAFQFGIQTVQDKAMDGGYNFNTLPLLPINKKNPPKPLFDEAKIKEQFNEIVVYNTPTLKTNFIGSEDILEYANDHKRAFDLGVQNTLIKGSFKNEMNSTYKKRVMFSKFRKTASMGHIKFDPKDGVFGCLDAKAKEELERVKDEASAISFYQRYGTNYVIEIGLGSLLQLTQAVELSHQMERAHVEAGISATIKQFPSLTDASAGLTSTIKTSHQEKTCSLRTLAVGGDHTKANDDIAFKAAAVAQPEIISYRTWPIYDEVEDDEKRDIMEKAYMKMMGEYEEYMPSYENKNEFSNEKYSIRAVWKYDDWWPGADRLYLELKYLGKTVIASRSMSKSDGYKFLDHIKRPGSKFGDGYDDTATFYSTKILGENSLSRNSGDLRGKC